MSLHLDSSAQQIPPRAPRTRPRFTVPVLAGIYQGCRLGSVSGRHLHRDALDTIRERQYGESPDTPTTSCRGPRGPGPAERSAESSSASGTICRGGEWRCYPSVLRMGNRLRV